MVDGASGKGVMGLMMLGTGYTFTLKVRLLYCWTFWDGFFVLGIWPLSNCVLDLGFEILAPWASVIRARKKPCGQSLFGFPYLLAFLPLLKWLLKNYANPLCVSVAPFHKMERKGCWEMTSRGVWSKKRG